MKTRISSKGQVGIPKAYRQKLGWEAGTELVVEDMKAAIDKAEAVSANTQLL